MQNTPPISGQYPAADWIAALSGGPLFPFDPLNNALGPTRIPFWHHVLAS